MRNLKLSITLVLLILFQEVSYAQGQSTAQNTVVQAQLEQVLAPIALYPDVVLSHILIAATYPLEVVQAQRWSANNPDLEGSEAVEAVDHKAWDPSVRALVAFPRILERMSADLDWTQQLGDSFLQNEAAVLASVQSLRQRAYQFGSLDDLERMSVSRDGESIVIQPIEREVVYLPYYDSRSVYGDWPWSHYSPVYWNSPYHAAYRDNRRYHPFYWGPRISISFGFFFNTFHWHNRHVVRIPYQQYRPRQYYNHYQISRDQRARRWQHTGYNHRVLRHRNLQVRSNYSTRLKRQGNTTERLRSRVRQRQGVLTKRRDLLTNKRANRNSQSVKRAQRDVSRHRPALANNARPQSGVARSRVLINNNQQRVRERRAAVQQRVNRNSSQRRSTSSQRGQSATKNNRKTHESKRVKAKKYAKNDSKRGSNSRRSRSSNNYRHRN